MSNQHLNAAFAQRGLEPLVKALLVALADQADASGVVACASRSRLMAMTSQSKASVKRGLRDLLIAGLLEVAEEATPTTAQRYALRLKGGVTQTPGVLQTPGFTQTPGVWSAGGEGSNGAASDPSYVPSAKIKAEPRVARLEVPTKGQLTKLVHTLFDNPPEWVVEFGDIDEALKRACAQAHFVYNATAVYDAVNRAVAARGGKAWLPLKGQELR